jgi:protease I
MTSSITGKRVAFLATDGVEEVEYTRPRAAVEEAGGTAELVSIKPGAIQAVHHLDKAGTYPVERRVRSATVDNYDALVLPGGVTNPDSLRLDPDAIRFVRDFFTAGKPVAAICHGPWTLVEAGVVDGRTLTSWPSLRTDLANAGAIWVDESVCADDGLLTSRKPEDLDAFCGALLKALS